MYKFFTAPWCGKVASFAPNILLVMKLTVIITLLTIFKVSASGYAQEVSLNLKSAPVQQVLNELTNQTGYNFICDASVIELSDRLTINVHKESLKSVLYKCFANRPVEIVFGSDSTVIIKTRREKSGSPLPQRIKITGKVTDAKGAIIPGVNVIIKGTQSGTTSDANGVYTIDAMPNSTLIFSYIGFKTQEVAVNNRNVVNMQMQEMEQSLNDVVVVGYATQKKLSLTSAVSVINADDVSRRPVTNSVQALQGLSPGLTIMDQGGAPGSANVTARIRGVTTLSGNDPLVLVDGIEQSINNINPDDIESVSVLKDAAATSIYGSRAATGVLLITTKRAKNGPVSVSYNGYAGLQRLGNHPKSIGTVDYLKLQNIAYVNANRPVAYSDELIAAYGSDAASDRIKYPLANDWFNVLYRDALQYNNNLSVSGGTDKFKGIVNIRDFRQDGVLKNFSNNVRELRINTDFAASKKLNFNFDANYRNIYNTKPRDAADIYFNTLHGSQLVVPRYPDGGYGLSIQAGNPLIDNELSGYDKDYFDNISVNLRGDWTILSGLKFSTQYGVTSTFDRNKIFTASYAVTDQNYPSRSKIRAVNNLSEIRSNTYQETINSTLNYNKVINQHTFNVLAGYSQIFNSASDLNAFRNTFYSNDIQAINLGSSGSKDNGGSDVSSGLRSYFGRVNYEFAGKYLLEATGRYDGSSKFTDNNLYSFFPSFSAGWRISQEAFWKPLINIIPEFKLRGSWGKTGNQTVGAYTFYEALSAQDYIFSGAAATGYALLNYANRDIKWETTRQTDIGFDASFLDTKLGVTFDYYDKKTSGILLNLPIAAAIGLNDPVQNAGVVSNKGWELGINYRNMDHALKYSAAFNISNNINKVLDLKGTGPYITGSSLDGLNATDVGLPIGVLWGFKTNGFYQDENDVATSPKYDPNTYPGDFKYVDLNGDGKITADDRTNIGDEFPHYTYGLTSNLQFKDFDLYVFFQGALKQDARISGAITAGGTNEAFVIDLANDYWTPSNTDARFPRPQKNTMKNQQISDFWVLPMGYLRVKNLQIGYSLPKSLIDKLGLQKLRIYLSGTNLFTISKANEWGIDAEFPTGRLNYYPQTRVYTFGTSVNF